MALRGRGRDRKLKVLDGKIELASKLQVHVPGCIAYMLRTGRRLEEPQVAEQPRLDDRPSCNEPRRPKICAPSTCRGRRALKAWRGATC